MHRRTRYALLALALVPFLHGCRSCSDPEAGARLRQLVWMKYIHVANVTELEASGPTGTVRLGPVDRTGFWAVFDICSLDVQGSDVTVFKYDTRNFYVDAGTVSYGLMNPGMVRTSFTSGALGSFDPQVRPLVHKALDLSPEAEDFPRQYYPTLHYRIAVFVNERPPRESWPLALKYANHPVTMQDISQAPPQERALHNAASPDIVGSCPPGGEDRPPP